MIDLEKARAADAALPYPLDAKEIWVSGKGQMHINPPNAPSIFFTLSDLCEFRNLFHGQADEIERMRVEMDNYGDDFVCQMKSKDAEIERLRLAYDTLRTSFLELNVLSGKKNIRIREQADRIQELEAQLALTTSALENATRKPDVIDATGTGNLDFSDTNVVDDLIKNGNGLRARAHKAEARIKELEAARCFDLEKARACAAFVEPKEAFLEALAEIERLRAKVGKMEFLMRSDDTCLACAIKLEVIDQQATRIQDLEEALVEDRAVDIAYDEGHLWSRLLQVDGGQRQEEYRERARSQLQLEGKIGPDAKPHSWQITDEQKAALGVILARIEYDQSLPGRFNYTVSRAKDVLRAMLKGAGQE